jgi:hypothetical protein
MAIDIGHRNGQSDYIGKTPFDFPERADAQPDKKVLTPTLNANRVGSRLRANTNGAPLVDLMEYSNRH